MTKKKMTKKVAPQEAPVTIDGVSLDQLLEPVDFSGAVSAGTPTHIGINRPKRDEWIRVHTGEEFIRAIWVIEEQQDLDREIYIVTPELAKAELEADARYAILHLAVSSTGRLFWWCIKMGTGSRRNHWAESALKAAEKAKAGWIRVMAAREGYEVWTAKASMPEPQWPDLSPEELTVLAFGERIIASLDHPVARRLTLGG